MILKRFLRPKWQHPDAEVRRQAVATLPSTDQSILLNIAETDQDASVRRTACKLINDLPALLRFARADADATVREIAFARCRQLLDGREPAPASAEERLALMDTIEDQRLLEHLAREAREPDLRRKAIERVARAEVLAGCAVHDTIAVNRAAAAERLQDRDTLQLVIQRIGKRDKNVYRFARQRIKEIAERDAAPERLRGRCVELCERAEQLGRYARWIQDKATMAHLQELWAEAEAEGPVESGLTQRFDTARTRFLDAYEAYRRENQAQLEQEEAREKLRQEKQTILDDLLALHGDENDESLEAKRKDVSARWEALPKLADADENLLQRRFEKEVEALDLRLKSRREQDDAREALAKLNQELETLADQGVPLPRGRTQRSLRAGAELASTRGPTEEERKRFDELRERIEHRLEKQHHAVEQKLAAIPEKLDELSTHIEAGELRKAEPLYQSIRSALEMLESDGVAKSQLARFEKRLHDISPEVREMQSWRRWGTDQHREMLCQTMQDLLSEDLEPAGLAERLFALRAEWKELEHSGAPLNQRLWERFNEAAEQVYERCKPYLEERAAEREQHRRERESICEQLEALLERADWEHMDWKKAQRAERETRAMWANLGPVEAKHRHRLEKRFRNALRRLDKHLSEERRRNLELKNNLISAVESLAEEPDLRNAIEETKRLQQQWHTTVAARQKEENRLWRQFRAACDRVFERRKASAASRQQELEQNQALRREILGDLQALAANATDVSSAQQAYEDLSARWEETEGLPLPGRAQHDLERDWRTARQDYAGRLRKLEGDRFHRLLDDLGQRAALCAEAERLAQQVHDGEAAARLSEAWQRLPELDEQDLRDAISTRFEAALSALSGNATYRERLMSALTENRRRRERLCLHLEILAGIDSPPEHTQERLAFQVSRLKEHIGEGVSDPLEEASRLLQDWFLTGPAPEEAAETLEHRFQRAREALKPE